MNNSLFGSVVWHFNQQYDMDSGWGDVKEGRRLMGNTNEYGSDPWATLRVVYKAMGLSKEEIAKHKPQEVWSFEVTDKMKELSMVLWT